MAKSKADIISAIDTYIGNFHFRKSAWYIGIAADPHTRLFTDHNVDEKSGIWIYEQAASDAIARDVEQAFLDSGYDGGTGGGDESTVYVYAYVKFQRTTQ